MACTAGPPPVSENQPSAARMPPHQTSNESTDEQLKLAQQQGQALADSVRWLSSHSAGGAEMAAGEYRITYLIGPAEGFYSLSNAGLMWHEPPPGTAHLRIVVRDAGDGRFVPNLDVHATLIESGHSVEEAKLPFGWYPSTEGYGENVSLPSSGPFTLRIKVAAPRFRRHDPANGKRFVEPAVAEFSNVSATADMSAQQPLSEIETAHLKELSEPRGQALQTTIHAMWKQAVSGAERPTQDYVVAYAIEYSEAYWYFAGSRFRYLLSAEQSAEHNAHVEVAPLDAATVRFLPELHVTATLLDDKGQTVGTSEEPFMWHPWLYHYGENWRVPHAGLYRLRVHIDPPAFRRYGREYGRRFSSPIDVEFDHVQIETGQK